jgi:hypothetical protein
LTGGETLITQADTTLRQHLSDDDPAARAVTILRELAGCGADEHETRERLAREYVSAIDELWPEDDRMTAIAKIVLGQCLGAQRRYEEAERLMLEGSAQIDSTYRQDHPLALLAR